MKSLLVFVIVCFLNTNLTGQATNIETLPVSIQMLEFAKTGSKIQLAWKVACFIDRANFEVQRSADGIAYSTIHSFSADKFRCSQPFYYDDVNASGRVYYRVKVGNKDGQFFSSKIVSTTGTLAGFTVNSLLPTIVKITATLSISSGLKQSISLIITNAQGQIVARKDVSLLAGNNDIKLDLSQLKAGIFIVSIAGNSGEKETRKFVKQ